MLVLILVHWYLISRVSCTNRWRFFSLHPRSCYRNTSVFLVKVSHQTRSSSSPTSSPTTSKSHKILGPFGRFTPVPLTFFSFFVKYACLFMLILDSDIITCLADRHFDGRAHKATLMSSLVLLLWGPKDGSLSLGVHWGCVCVFGGDKLHQINEGKTHSLMEDGKESPLIKNMKMNKISGSFGSIWTATLILSDLHLIKKGSESVLHHFLCVLWGTMIFILFFTDANNENKVLHSDK